MHRRPVLNEAWHSAAMQTHGYNGDTRPSLASWAQELGDQAIDAGYPPEQVEAEVGLALRLCAGEISLAEFRDSYRQLRLESA